MHDAHHIEHIKKRREKERRRRIHDEREKKKKEAKKKRLLEKAHSHAHGLNGHNAEHKVGHGHGSEGNVKRVFKYVVSEISTLLPPHG